MTDWKGRLIAIARRTGELPHFTVCQDGPLHSATFVAEVAIGDKVFKSGWLSFMIN
jgi:hypothetical protein